MAFVPSSGGFGACKGAGFVHATRSRDVQLSRVARRRGACRLRMAEKKEEPYPGYFKDLERAGVPKPKPKRVGGKKSLYREDGTPYAPWMIGLVNEEEVDTKPKAPKTDAKGKLAFDPQSQELSGLGLKFKVIGDQEVEVLWNTAGEDGIAGFVVQRRRGKESEWETLSDYKLNPSLKSKGPSGGVYTFLDDGVSPGSWIYRVSDIGQDGKQNDLAQGLVEIESSSDALKQKIALGVFVILAAALLVFGVISDPQSGL